ncbi:hypothetical protein [Phaffia rhodozyma]|uniref:Uncharacterized protein n=1 Tax=Phaffia rhodozyma TaxID=264483 RepID=A0A0F7SLB4_PHARH|nr:hypothetical protein [Phaffia rhodozyma]
MDLNDQSQYQNLSYTFQNLALSPPPPPPAEPPYSGLSDPYDSSSNPVFGSSPSGDYSSFMTNSSSSSSQKIGQPEGPEGAGYAPSDDGIAHGKSMNTSGISGAGAGSRTGWSGSRAGSGEGGMGSIGRGGWGSSNGSVGSVNGNGNPGSIQSVNRGKMGRAELPSQWLDQPFHNPSPNGRSPVGFVSFQQQQQQQQYQLGDSTSTGSMSPPILHPSQNSTYPVSPLLSSEYVNSHSQSVGDSSYNSYGSSALSSSPGASRQQWKLLFIFAYIYHGI